MCRNFSNLNNYYGISVKHQTLVINTRNGLAAMTVLSAGPEFKSHLPPVEFFFYLQQGFSTLQSNLNTNICAMCLSKLPEAHIKHPTQKRWRKAIRAALTLQCRNYSFAFKILKSWPVVTQSIASRKYLIF